MATKIEYALIAALIAVPAVAGVWMLNNKQETPEAVSVPDAIVQTIEIVPGQTADVGFSHPASPRITLGPDDPETPYDGGPFFICPPGFRAEMLGIREGRCVPA